jgi:hypothetical protein
MLASNAAAMLNGYLMDALPQFLSLLDIHYDDPISSSLTMGLT